jgi:hypothetical protein
MTKEDLDLEEDQECNHIWELNECDGDTHYYVCQNCGEEDEGDCDCEDLEDEEDEPEAD